MDKDDDARSVDSSFSSQNAPAPRPPLPITALRQKIVEKIQENRVTLIVGETGCGKSSQVPLFLLEENMEPILCTQPRRFAVVTIARMVAKARNCEVGGEVGYHIGHSNITNITSARSKLVFKTAGVLLEQMRDRGLAALKYKVIILDEVHERSVESDLVLACVKQFMMRSSDLRVVLMSATADIARYKDYFRDLGRGERVEVIAVPSAPQHSIFQRKVLYLEEVAKLLGIVPTDSESLSSSYCSGPNHYADADFKPQVYTLIHMLILHIHDKEPDIEKSILVFLPTYYALEKQWILLKPLSSLFKVHILHSSIDTDQALLAMKIWKSHRKVILATNIAESSVTIPGVAFVIDSCRSLQVLWDPNTKNDTAELVWVSKSQAEQRRGRTGRTCDGQIYRLVTQSFYSGLDDYEHPAILRLSMRHQVLMICCAESKAINDPKAMLQKVLDPPEPETVEEALNLLVHIRALEQPLTNRARYEPTLYGRLLDSLPLSFDASVLAIRFGEIGLLREGILISILMDVQPLPILQPFGNPTLATKYVDNYFEVDASDALQAGKKETVFIANMCAFQFWQHAFKDKHRLERLKEIITESEPKTSQLLIRKLEEEWCSLHNILQTSLHNVSETYEDVISGLHRFRPAFFTANELPAYCEPNAFKHTCVLQSELVQEMNGLTLDDEKPELVAEKEECLATPYVTSSDFQANNVLEKWKLLIKELRLQYMEEPIWNHRETFNSVAPKTEEAVLCRYFMSGSCTRGNQCFFSHSLQVKKPMCKFFLTLKISSSIGKQVNVRPLRSSLKLMWEFIRKFKKHIQGDFVDAMKKTPFGPIFMAFFNKEFGAEKGLKSNISVLKIVDQYDRDTRTFRIGGKQIELTVEDVALTFSLPINGADFIMNKTCTMKDRGVIKHYFLNIKKMTKVSIEEALDDHLVKKRRSELDVTKDEQLEQQVTLNEIIKDRQRLAAQDFTTIIILYMLATLFFSDSKCTVPWYIVEQIANMQLMKTICWVKAVWQFLIESMDIFRHTTYELQGCSVQIIGCRNGASCFFSHDYRPHAAAITAPIFFSQEDPAASAYSFLQLLPTSGYGCVLLLNDKDLRFTSSLSHHYVPTKIIATTTRSYSSDLVASLGDVKILWNASNPCDSIIETKGKFPILWKELRSVLWFVETDENDSNIQHHFIQNFFEFLAIRVLAEKLYDLQVIVTMNNIRFAQLQVERIARECFFFLARSFPFDEYTFGKVMDPIVITRPMQVCAPISYVFNIRPPTNIQSGDYAAVLRNCLYGDNH